MISVLIFGFLWWSSSWRWQPHIGVCRLLWPLLRAGMAVLTQFFLQNVFFICIPEPQKKFGRIFWCFTPQKETFFFIGGAWLARFPELRACPHFWKSAALGNHINPRWEYRPDHFSGIEGMPSFLEKCSRWSFLVMAIIHIDAKWTCDRVNTGWFIEYLSVRLASQYNDIFLCPSSAVMKIWRHKHA